MHTTVLKNVRFSERCCEALVLYFGFVECEESCSHYVIVVSHFRISSSKLLRILFIVYRNYALPAQTKANIEKQQNIKGRDLVSMIAYV